MARPKKNNAEYFTHDADMRNDVKVKALRRKFGHTGYAVWCFILESLTDSDFFQMDYSTVSRELLAADYDVSTEQLTDIVDYCMLIGLLQQTEDNLLYSEAHQRRFSTLLYNRERKRLNLAGINPNTQGNGEVMARRNIAETPENDSNGDVKPHSKVKENKGEESKGKENKDIVYPYRDIVALWNEICFSLPKVKVVSDSRKAKIKTRLQEFGSADEWLNVTRELCQKVQASDFLRGNNNHNWTATFDWLFENGSNWVKVQEGNYDNKRGTQGRKTAENGLSLGVGEFIDAQGHRTYGTGAANIPYDAPARPSDRHAWNASTKQWVIL